MKKLLSLIIIVITFIIACEQQSPTMIEATIVRDCTGTYLRVDNKDYWVCNYRKTDPFATGAMVLAAFEKSANCNSDFSSCYLLHESEGWIEVKKIKKL